MKGKGKFLCETPEEAVVTAQHLQVVETFARDCFVGYDPLCSDPSKYRFCLADEHYVSTLLAVSSSFWILEHGPSHVKNFGRPYCTCNAVCS